MEGMNVPQKRETAGLLDFQADAGIAQVTAELQAQMLWAVKFPRDEERAFNTVMQRCKSFTFADKGTYELERKNKRTGEVKKIRGLGTDLASEALKHWKNVRISTDLVSETDDSLLLTVSAYDLEANLKIPEMVFVSKTIEKSWTEDGQVVISERVNSNGKRVYVVRATDEELRIKIAAVVSKARRNVILRLIRSDYLEAWLEQAMETKAVEAEKQAKTKEGKEKLLRAFSDLGITQGQLEEYLEHPFGGLTSEEWVHLRGVYRSVKDEGISWKDIMQEAKEGPSRGNIGLDDLQPGNVADHTEPDMPPLSAEEPITEIKKAAFPTDRVGAENLLKDKLAALWPDHTSANYKAVCDGMWAATGLNGWSGVKDPQSAEIIVDYVSVNLEASIRLLQTRKTGKAKQENLL